MNKNETIFKNRFTLRLDPKIDKEIEEKAKSMGVSKNAYISMVLHKEINKTG